MLVVAADGLSSLLRHVTAFIAKLFYKIRKFNKIKYLHRKRA